MPNHIELYINGKGMLVSFVIREVEVLTFLMQSRFEWKNTPIGDTDYITLTVDRSMERSNRQ